MLIKNGCVLAIDTRKGCDTLYGVCLQMAPNGEGSCSVCLFFTPNVNFFGRYFPSFVFSSCFHVSEVLVTHKESSGVQHHIKECAMSLVDLSMTQLSH